MASAGELALFARDGFDGREMTLRSATPNLVDADFGGRCMTCGPGRYERLGPLGNMISSVRRVR